MAKDKPAPAADAAKGGKKKKKKLIIMIAAAVLLLGGGGAGGYFMFFTGGKKEPAKPKPGIVVVLAPVTVNLTDGHFLKISIALQATDAVSEDVDGSKALDILISQFSNRSVAELSSNAAREEAKKQLTEKISKAYDEEIYAIYFTEFVMQ
jgi:flagellar FliL protein